MKLMNEMVMVAVFELRRIRMGAFTCDVTCLRSSNPKSTGRLWLNMSSCRAALSTVVLDWIVRSR